MFTHLPDGEDIDTLTPDVVRFIQNQMRHRKNYIGHSADDIRDIFDTVSIEGGGIRIQREQGRILSATVYDKAGGKVHIHDQFTDTGETSSDNYHRTAQIGMVKIIDTDALPHIDTLRSFQPTMSMMLD